MSNEYIAVERDGSKVSIVLGDAPPLTLQPETAIKLACLLMKYAGAAVRVHSGQIVAMFSKKALRDGPPRSEKPEPDPIRLLN